jgi:hypothetical protein
MCKASNGVTTQTINTDIFTVLRISNITTLYLIYMQFQYEITERRGRVVNTHTSHWDVQGSNLGQKTGYPV